jgi:hypothetical protein
MRILCTGNPCHATVASEVKKFWNSAEFASRATGFDFKTWSTPTQELFKKSIVKYNVFINSSYIDSGIQLNLLNATCNAWMGADIKGHIVSIGTTLEWKNNVNYIEYITSKQHLRSRSLELNEQTGITGVKTSYIIVGGVNDGTYENRNNLELSSIIRAMDWVLNTNERIGLLQIETAK